MSYRLLFDGVDDVVTFGTAITRAVGTASWNLKFRLILDAYPSTGNWYILGSSAATTNGGFALRQASGNGVFSIISGGTHIAAADSPVGFILNDGLPHTYEIDRVGGSTISFYRDGVAIQVNKSWATSTAFTLTLNRMGKGSVSGTGATTPMELEWLDATLFDTTNGQLWDAGLNTSGTGLTLPTLSGSNQGTLVNFPSDDSEWVFYGSGGPFTVNLNSISSTLALYSPVVTKDKRIDLNALGPTAILYAPSVNKQKLVNLNRIEATTTLYQPSVSKQGEKVLGLAFIPSSALVRNPSVLKDKRIALDSIGSTVVMYSPSVLSTKIINVGYRSSTAVVYEHQVIGGATPLPDLPLYPAEGYGLHMRTAQEMKVIIEDLARRLAILEGRELP